jgi:predicted ATP-dependent serine protease
MIISHKNTRLKKVSSINIPKTFFSRLKTGIAPIDQLFGGEGILPGSVGTIAAPAGSGKTSLFLQVCQSLCDNGYSTAYVTGEESTEMLAYTCKRLGVKDVLVANENDLDTVMSYIDEVDFVVYDSFPCLSTDGRRNGRREQEDAIGRIVSKCKEAETAMVIVLHVTKSGQFKGSTTIPHAVDMNFEIEVDEEQPEIRTISSSKNRYGTLANISLYFGARGFDFTTKIEREEGNKAQSKASRKNNELEKIKIMTEPPGITIARVCKELGVDATRAGYLLRDLVQSGAMVKYGRGNDATWKFTL